MPVFTPALDLKYVKVGRIGKGGFGSVYRVKTKDNSEQSFAIKRVSMKDDQLKAAIRELTILKNMKHPNLLLYIEHEITDAARLYIVTEFVAGGDLLKRIVHHERKNEYMAEPICQFIFCQIVKAINYLHNRGVIHRDIKPNNILLSDDSNRPVVKVADFGLSRPIDNTMATSCGTKPFAAPEVLLSNNTIPYTIKADIWSLGATLHAMLGNVCPPRDPNDPLRVMFTAPVTESASLCLIQTMLQGKPDARPPCAAILSDPWVMNAQQPEAADPAQLDDANPLPAYQTMPMKRHRSEKNEPIECMAKHRSVLF